MIAGKDNGITPASPHPAKLGDFSRNPGVLEFLAELP